MYNKDETYKKDLNRLLMHDINMEYSKWQKEIPYIQFDPDMEVRMCPPFGGAIVRFAIKKGDAWVSVYLDAYENIGVYDGETPYWEIYPSVDGDVHRCDMNNTEELMNAIRNSFVVQNARKNEE